MKTRYWFVLMECKNMKEEFAVTSNEENPLSIERIKYLVSKKFNLNKSELVVLNFIEFKTQKEYNDFFKIDN